MLSAGVPDNVIQLTTSVQAIHHLEKGEVIFGPVKPNGGIFCPSMTIIGRKTEEHYEIVLYESDGSGQTYGACINDPKALDATRKLIHGCMGMGIDFYVYPGATLGTRKLPLWRVVSRRLYYFIGKCLFYVLSKFFSLFKRRG